MATLDSLKPVANADQLDAGYFNGVSTTQMKSNIINALNHKINATNSIPQDNMVLVCSLDETETDQTNSTGGMISAYNNRIYFGSVFDNFEDASINGTKWTTSTTAGDGSATVGETGGYIYMDVDGKSSGAAGTDSQASIISQTGFTGDCVFIFEGYLNANGSQDYIKLQISDGTNHIDIDSRTTSGTTAALYEVIVDSTAQTVDVWRNGTQIQTDLDVSTVTGGYEIRMHAYGDCSSSEDNHFIGRYYWFIAYNSAASSDFVSAATTLPATSGVGYWYMYDNTGATITGSLSANGGTNYTSSTVESMTTISNTGTSGKIKLTATPTTSAVTSCRAAGAWIGA